MRKIISLLLIISVISVACTDFDDKLNVQIRVQNNTEILLTKVAIDSLEYKDIDAGTKTAYQVKNDFIPVRQLIVEVDSVVIPTSIDNVQQDTLQPGRYTYKIDTFSVEEGVQFEVIQD